LDLRVFAPESRPLDYRGLDSVPQLPLADDDAKSVIWHEVHELLGFAMIGLLLVHIVGAVRHQRAGSALRERMLVSRPRWLRPLISLAVLVWLLGLSLDLLGTRVT
jgi:cytochrome b561